MRTNTSLRQVRLERKLRRTVRCEWCSRTVRVSKKLWMQLFKDKFGHWMPADQVLEKRSSEVFVCSRTRCIKSRPEGWSVPWEVVV